MMTRTNENLTPLTLLSLSLDLLENTEVRCHDLVRHEQTKWIIFSMPNMTIPLQPNSTNQSGSAGSSKGESEEITIDSNIWRGKPLPSTVAPSFVSCAIVRKYELLVKVGIGYGINPAKKVCVTML